MRANAEGPAPHGPSDFRRRTIDSRPRPALKQIRSPFKEQRGSSVPAGAIDIAGVDLPHISNFTDFDAFRIEPEAAVKLEWAWSLDQSPQGRRT